MGGEGCRDEHEHTPTENSSVKILAITPTPFSFLVAIEYLNGWRYVAESYLGSLVPQFVACCHFRSKPRPIDTKCLTLRSHFCCLSTGEEDPDELLRQFVFDALISKATGESPKLYDQ